MQHAPTLLPSRRGGRSPARCGGRRAAVGNWKWQTLARRCREGHYVGLGTKCQERGGSGPVSKGQGPARVPSVFLAGLSPGCVHRGPGRASAQRAGRICQVLPDLYRRVPSDVPPAPQSKASLIQHSCACAFLLHVDWEQGVGGAVCHGCSGFSPGPSTDLGSTSRKVAP